MHAGGPAGRAISTTGESRREEQGGNAACTQGLLQLPPPCRFWMWHPAGQLTRALLRTWPLVAGPAPIPMVGMLSSEVTAAATAAGTHSSTTEKQPAASKACTSGSASGSRKLGWGQPATAHPCWTSPPFPYITARLGLGKLVPQQSVLPATYADQPLLGILSHPRSIKY